MTESAKPIPVAAALPARKTPLTEAAALLAELMERIDNGEDLSEALVQAFHDTRVGLAEAVDRRIAFANWLKGAVMMAKEQRDEWRLKVQQLEMLEERFKSNTQAVLEERPDVPFVGSMGRIALQRNPPALKLAFGAKDVTPDMIRTFQIPEDYVVTKTVHEIDTQKLKADILAGKTIVFWAWIEQGQSVRFRK